MKTLTVSVALTLAALAVPLCAQQPATPTTSPTTAPAEGSPEAMLAAIQAVQMPRPDMARRGDPAYVQSFTEARKAAVAERTELMHAFVSAHPTHEAAAPVASALVGATASLGRPVSPMVEELLALPLSDDGKMAIRAFEMQILVSGPNPNLEAANAKLEAFKRERPGDERVGQIAFMLATAMPAEQRAEKLRAVVSEFPNSQAATSAAAKLRQIDAVGKPFELAFNDAKTGKPIDLQKDMKGKVVVLDFWATWCGPCVADMPKMKEIYAQYQNQGVEFIGISLDQPEEQGGKQKLLEFIETNNVPWPQYYQGNFWDSEFSKGWGVDSIPALFVIDAQGKLVTVNGRETLETLLPELIAKRGA